MITRFTSSYASLSTLTKIVTYNTLMSCQCLFVSKISQDDKLWQQFLTGKNFVHVKN